MRGVRVAPVGLYTYLSSLPRVWSPLQGYAPWALEGVAPLGLLLLVYPTQGLVVLSGLRSLGFGWVAPMGA